MANKRIAVRYSTKANGKNDRMPFQIHEDLHDDSGIGMSMLSNEVDHTGFHFEADLIPA